MRSGKGDAYREVELNALVCGMLDECVIERAKIAPAEKTRFFVARTGRALSSRSIDLAVRRVADRARLQLSAHVLRHTFVRPDLRFPAFEATYFPSHKPTTREIYPGGLSASVPRGS